MAAVKYMKKEMQYALLRAQLCSAFSRGDGHKCRQLSARMDAEQLTLIRAAIRKKGMAV